MKYISFFILSQITIFLILSCGGASQEVVAPSTLVTSTPSPVAADLEGHFILFDDTDPQLGSVDYLGDVDRWNFRIRDGKFNTISINVTFVTPTGEQCSTKGSHQIWLESSSGTLLSEAQIGSGCPNVATIDHISLDPGEYSLVVTNEFRTGLYVVKVSRNHGLAPDDIRRWRLGRTGIIDTLSQDEVKERLLSQGDLPDGWVLESNGLSLNLYHEEPRYLSTRSPDFLRDYLKAHHKTVERKITLSFEIYPDTESAAEEVKRGLAAAHLEFEREGIPYSSPAITFGEDKLEVMGTFGFARFPQGVSPIGQSEYESWEAHSNVVIKMKRTFNPDEWMLEEVDLTNDNLENVGNPRICGIYMDWWGQEIGKVLGFHEQFGDYNTLYYVPWSYLCDDQVMLLQRYKLSGHPNPVSKFNDPSLLHNRDIPEITYDFGCIKLSMNMHKLRDRDYENSTGSRLRTPENHELGIKMWDIIKAGNSKKCDEALRELQDQ